MFHFAGVQTIEARIADLDKSEAEMAEEKVRMVAKIEELTQETKNWETEKINLLGQLKSLQQQVANLSPSLRERRQKDQAMSDANKDNNNLVSDNTPEIRTPAAPLKPATRGRKIKKKETGPPKEVDPEVFRYSLKWPLNQHLDCVRAITFHPTLALIATGSDDGTIRITNLDPPRHGKRRAPVQYISMRGHSGPVLSLAAKQNILVSGDMNGVLCFWEFGEMRTTLYEPHGKANHHLLHENHCHTDSLWSIATNESSPFIVTASSDGTIRTHSIENFTSSDPIQIPEIPSIVEFNPDGTKFVVGCKDGTIHVYKSATEREKTLKIDSRIIDIVFYNIPTQIVIACHDNKIKLLDIESGELLKETMAHSGPITGVTMLHGGNFLATTSSDKNVRAWKSSDFSVKYAETLHREKIGEGGLCIAATPPTSKYEYFASGGADGGIKIFANA